MTTRKTMLLLAAACCITAAPAMAQSYDARGYELRGDQGRAMQSYDDGYAPDADAYDRAHFGFGFSSDTVPYDDASRRTSRSIAAFGDRAAAMGGPG